MSSATIVVIVNGTREQVEADSTIAGLIESVATSAKGLAVACNGEVVPRSAWQTTTLHSDDRIEILTPAQGG